MMTPDEKGCLGKALQLLERRDHSCLELSRKLKQRGYSADVIDTAIAACAEMNYLDDRRFCQGYTRQLRRRGYGRMRIVQKLKERGIADAFIREIIERRCGEACQVEDCVRVIEKRRADGPTLQPSRKDRERLFRFLYQRGFSSDVIRQAERQSVNDME
jgi:regulatory protein